MAMGLNSGIFFRCIPGDKMMGYESQIHNGMVDGDPTKPVDCGTGGIFRRQNARRIVARDHEWFAKTIVADGPHMAVWVNGYQVSDWTDDRAANENPRRGLRLEPGTLQIQGHDPTTDLEFRKLRIAEIPGEPEALRARRLQSLTLLARLPLAPVADASGSPTACQFCGVEPQWAVPPAMRCIAAITL